MTYPKPPAPFLSIIVHDELVYPPLAALCVGYESGKWRYEGFAEHVMEWLPEFSLSTDELASLSPGTAVRLVKKAARLVYQTDKYGRRGEFGEIFLHMFLRQLYGTIPAISKIFWKDSVNTTVKGFDAVHVVDNTGCLELWLGEVKFYKDGASAICDVAKEIEGHIKTDYLKNEFMLIANKISQAMPHYDRLVKLLDQNTSLDEVFDAACIPVLITYESSAVKGHAKSDDNYRNEVLAEVNKLKYDFDEKTGAGKLPIKLHLFVMPIHTKEHLVEVLDEKLKELQ